MEQLPAMLRRYFQPELLEVGWGREGNQGNGMRIFRINPGCVNVFRELASHVRKQKGSICMYIIIVIYNSRRLNCRNSLWEA